MAISLLVLAAWTPWAVGAEKIPCVSYSCVVADSGLVVSEMDPEAVRVPASMIKMMLMLLVAEGLEEEKWTLETPVEASMNAQRLGGSQVYLKSGETHPLSEYMYAIGVLSANDAALAVAEGLWGSEEAYLEAANIRAVELGMRDTLILSPHGLTLGEETDLTTARDLTILARHCVTKPQIMAWVANDTYAFRETDAERRSTNRLKRRMPDCDGLKTGYTRAAGWCFAATAERDGVRLIAVVMGCTNVRERFNAAEAVLEEGFTRMRRVRLLEAGQEVDPAVPVENSKKESIRLAVTEPVFAVVDAESEGQVRYLAELPETLRAPLEAGTIVGTLKVQAGELTLATSPLAVPYNLDAPAWPWKVRKSVIKQRPEKKSARVQGDYEIVGTGK